MRSGAQRIRSRSFSHQLQQRFDVRTAAAVVPAVCIAKQLHKLHQRLHIGHVLFLLRARRRRRRTRRLFRSLRHRNAKPCRDLSKHPIRQYRSQSCKVTCGALFAALFEYISSKQHRVADRRILSARLLLRRPFGKLSRRVSLHTHSPPITVSYAGGTFFGTDA